MIEGLKIEMSSEQLAGRLAERIRWHEQTIEAYREALLQTEVRGRAHRNRSVLEHQVREHQEQTAVLSLLREHLIPGEVYRLTECDLRFADLVPDPYLGSFVRPELDEEGAEVSADPA